MSQSRSCPQCGASVSKRLRKCWLCHAALSAPAAESTDESRETPSPIDFRPASTNANAQFTLASLMLIITLVAVCLGAFTIAPGLGIGLAIAALPAVLRTTVLVQDFKVEHGESPGMIEKALTFVASLFLFLVIAVACAIGFYATCWVGFVGGAIVGGSFNAGETGGVIVGGIAALLILIWMWRKLFWPRKKGRPRHSDYNLPT